MEGKESHNETSNLPIFFSVMIDFNNFERLTCYYLQCGRILVYYKNFMIMDKLLYQKINIDLEECGKVSLEEYLLLSD